MRHELSELEVNILRQSPYLESVNPKKVIHGAVFEREYHRLIQAGYSPKESYEWLGVDTEIIGKAKIRSYHHRYNMRLADGQINIPMEDGKPLSISQELEAKNHQIKILEQELEFLKKKMQLTHQFNQRKDSSDITSD